MGVRAGRQEPDSTRAYFSLFGTDLDKEAIERLLGVEGLLLPTRRPPSRWSFPSPLPATSDVETQFSALLDRFLPMVDGVRKYCRPRDLTPMLDAGVNNFSASPCSLSSALFQRIARMDARVWLDVYHLYSVGHEDEEEEEEEEDWSDIEHRPPEVQAFLTVLGSHLEPAGVARILGMPPAAFDGVSAWRFGSPLDARSPGVDHIEALVEILLARADALWDLCARRSATLLLEATEVMYDDCNTDWRLSPELVRKIARSRAALRIRGAFAEKAPG